MGELLQYGNVAHLPEVDAGVAEENGTKGISCRCHVHVTEDDRATRKIVTRHSLSGDDFGGLAECGQTEQSPSFYQRTLAFLKAEGELSWLDSYRWFIFDSWLNLLLLFIPVAAVAHYLNWDAPLRFGFSFVAIIPLAKLLGDATEQMSLSLGQTLAGLLNATFSNAVEIIVGIVALFKGEVRIVQTSYQFHEPLMTLAGITLVIPAAYHASKRVNLPVKGDVLATMSSGLHTDPDNGGRRGLLIISCGTAILLLGVYVAYLIFQLKTHASLFSPPSWEPREGQADESAQRVEEEEEIPRMSIVAAGASRSRDLQPSNCYHYHVSCRGLPGHVNRGDCNRLDIPKTFIGLMLLPIVANAGELVTSVCMAMKDNMELIIGVCVDSSIEVATFVLPLLVVTDWCSGHDLTLFFDDFESAVSLLLQDGKSNYMEGLMLSTLYLAIDMACVSTLLSIPLYLVRRYLVSHHVIGHKLGTVLIPSTLAGVCIWWGAVAVSGWDSLGGAPLLQA
ncbi:hypothetical protein BJV77DRAFT_1148540 [Russula vinacea]|nr:hypothetical protein BJV77DRAFT_1148540 [Russula vinacea]